MIPEPPQTPLKALIVDDEMKARQNLRQLITRYCPELEVVGEAADLQEAKAYIRQYRPDILFQDICMPGEQGLEFVENSIVDHEVIFVTAYDQYPLRALKAGAADYLMKPVTTKDLKEAVWRAQKNIEQKNIKQTPRPPDPLPTLSLPVPGGLELLEVNTILYVESDNSYCTIHSAEGRKVISRSIGKLESSLLETGFMRIHNSYLVNRTCIVRFSTQDGGTLTLKNGRTLPVAKRRLKSVKEQLYSQVRQI